MEKWVLLATLVFLWLTFTKIRDRRTEWWINIWPMGLGACLISWVAYFVV
jgi:hypothetical protein